MAWYFVRNMYRVLDGRGLQCAVVECMRCSAVQCRGWELGEVGKCSVGGRGSKKQWTSGDALVCGDWRPLPPRAAVNMEASVLTASSSSQASY